MLGIPICKIIACLNVDVYSDIIRKKPIKTCFFLSITIGIGTVLVRETSSLSDILIATFLEARSKNYFFYICNINSVCFVIDFWWRRCCIFIWINRGYNTVTWIYPLFNFFFNWNAEEVLRTC